MSKEKIFGELSEFKGRDVELFRSSDQHETAIYFTEDEDKHQKDSKAYFELLRFELTGGDHQIYIRFSNTDYFVEMIDAGFGSGRGDMMVASGKDVWKDVNKSPLTIYSHNNDLLLIMGRTDWLSEFNFMKRVAKYDKGNKYNRPYPNETFINYWEIENTLKMKYLKIPQNIRKVEYCFKTMDQTPKYILIEYPAHNFHYDNHNFYIIENNIAKEYKIKKFERYRDGGTTYITIVDEHEKEFKLYSPTPFDKTLKPTFDEKEIIECTKEEEKELINLLQIELEPETEQEEIKI